VNGRWRSSSASPPGAGPPFEDVWLLSRGAGALLARGGDRRYLRSFSARSLRLAAQDVALSRRKQGFESPRERQSFFVHFDFSPLFVLFPKPPRSVWAILFALRPSSFIIASVASRV
jgi:hypothetical protein